MDTERRTVSEPIDGRRARRQRSREAIVDAAFALILEGKGPPAAEDVAERAGVSVSSIFRNFDGLADIQQQALDLFNERYSHLLVAAPPADADIAARTTFLVRNRLDLYEQAGPLMAVARARAFADDSWGNHVARYRLVLAAQVRLSLGPAIDLVGPADAANIVAVVDSFTSPEAFEIMTRSHARSRRQIERSWTAGVRVLIDNCYAGGLTPGVTPRKATR